MKLDDRRMDANGTIHGTITVQGVILVIMVEGDKVSVRYPSHPNSWQPATVRQIAFLVENRRRTGKIGEATLDKLLADAENLDANFDECVQHWKTAGSLGR